MLMRLLGPLAEEWVEGLPRCRGNGWSDGGVWAAGGCSCAVVPCAPLVGLAVEPAQLRMVDLGGLVARCTLNLGCTPLTGLCPPARRRLHPPRSAQTSAIPAPSTQAALPPPGARSPGLRRGGDRKKPRGRAAWLLRMAALHHTQDSTPSTTGQHSNTNRTALRHTQRQAVRGGGRAVRRGGTHRSMWRWRSRDPPRHTVGYG